MSPSSVSVLFFLLVLHLLVCGAYGACLGKVKFGMKPSSSSSSIDHQYTDLIMKNSNVVKKEDNNINNNNNNNDVEKRELMVRVECQDEDDCGAKGKSRKIVTPTIMSTFTSTSIQKNVENNRANKGMEDLMMITRGSEGRKMSSSSSFMHTVHEVRQEEVVHPSKNQAELIDITEMDYSPATRKPPIHN